MLPKSTVITLNVLPATGAWQDAKLPIQYLVVVITVTVNTFLAVFLRVLAVF